MKEYKMSLGTNGRITVPKKIRSELGIKAGDWLGIWTKENKLFMKKVNKK